MFNVIFTPLPIIVFALFDEVFASGTYAPYKDAPQNYLEKQPLYYFQSMEGSLFNLTIFIGTLLKGLIHGIIITVISYIFFQPFFIADFKILLI